MRLLNRSFICYFHAIIISLFISFIIPSTSFSYDLPGWYNGASGYEDALSASIQNETPIIVFFYLESDELSQKLRYNYLRNYEVYSFLDNFLNVAVNLEGNDFDRELAKTNMKALKLDPKCKECSAELERLKENKNKISGK